MCGFISGLSILFHWSICLFLCWQYTLLITLSMTYNWEFAPFDSSPISPTTSLHLHSLPLATTNLLFVSMSSVFFFFLKILHIIISMMPSRSILVTNGTISSFFMADKHSSVYGILQAKILGLFTISFSRWSSWPRDRTQVPCIGGWIFLPLSHQGSLHIYLKVKVKLKSLSRVRLFATPWTVAYQTPPSMGFSRQEYWSGLPSPSPGDFPNPGIEPRSPTL